MDGMKWFEVTPNVSRLAACAVAAFTVYGAVAQSEVHGRGWKPLPPTSHIVVTVVKGFNGKPLSNAAVVFHAVRNGKNDGNLEVKTDEEGKAAIDVIEIGSHLTVQVIASGFATSASEMDVDGPAKELEVKMLRPRGQVSVYQDNSGQPSTEKPGIQEPAHAISPKPTPTTPPTDPTKPTSEPPPASTTPPMEARLRWIASPFQQVPAPVSPTATVPALDTPTVSKDPAATVSTAPPATTSRPAATPLATPPTATAPVAKPISTPSVEVPSAGPRRAAPPSSVPGTASPLSVAAPVTRPLTTPQVVTAPVATQRGGPRTAPATPSTDAAPLSVTQRSAGRPSATPTEPTQFLAAPPTTAPQAAAPTAIALPKNANQTADTATPTDTPPASAAPPAPNTTPAPTTPPASLQK